jgi:hypothetical protein
LLSAFIGKTEAFLGKLEHWLKNRTRRLVENRQRPIH